MSDPDDKLLAKAQGLMRGESATGFRSRMEDLARLQSAIHAGNLSSEDAARQLHALLPPDVETFEDPGSFDYLFA
ncbi:MAG: hypothetical protein SGJ21_13985 [Alphaproteobacteria bacterium]|nr:hypothetical protein [Alphaproteobacteria bacterium]